MPICIKLPIIDENLKCLALNIIKKNNTTKIESGI